jgi:hypothetical protein
MTCRRIVTAALLSSALAVPAFAQQTQEPQQEGVDVSKLPVNLDRIQRQLQQTNVREERDGLNLRYIIDVYGRAPRIELFPKQENLLTGPVPYGAPTHREVLQQLTPQEFSAPAADLGSFFRWLSDKAKDKSR